MANRKQSEQALVAALTNSFQYFGTSLLDDPYRLVSTLKDQLPNSPELEPFYHACREGMLAPFAAMLQASSVPTSDGLQQAARQAAATLAGTKDLSEAEAWHMSSLLGAGLAPQLKLSFDESGQQKQPAAVTHETPVEHEPPAKPKPNGRLMAALAALAVALVVAVVSLNAPSVQEVTNDATTETSTGTSEAVSSSTKDGTEEADDKNDSSAEDTNSGASSSNETDTDTSADSSDRKGTDDETPKQTHISWIMPVSYAQTFTSASGDTNTICTSEATYDGQGRLTQLDLESSFELPDQVSVNHLDFSYDDADRLARVEISGDSSDIWTIDHGADTRHLESDPNHCRMPGQGHDRYSIDETYDDGRLTAMQCYVGVGQNITESSYTMNYDGRDRLSHVSGNRYDPVSYDVSYHDNDVVSQIEYSSKYERCIYQYDEQGRITSSQRTNLNSSDTVSETYTYDGDDPIPSRIDRSGGNALTYQRDGMSVRLHETSEYGFSYDTTIRYAEVTTAAGTSPEPPGEIVTPTNLQMYGGIWVHSYTGPFDVQDILALNKVWLSEHS